MESCPYFIALFHTIECIQDYFYTMDVAQVSCLSMLLLTAEIRVSENSFSHQ